MCCVCGRGFFFFFLLTSYTNHPTRGFTEVLVAMIMRKLCQWAMNVWELFKNIWIILWKFELFCWNMSFERVKVVAWFCVGAAFRYYWCWRRSAAWAPGYLAVHILEHHVCFVDSVVFCVGVRRPAFFDILISAVEFSLLLMLELDKLSVYALLKPGSVTKRFASVCTRRKSYPRCLSRCASV
jgi:hypothetical protein